MLNPRSPELLAPAGQVESFAAAVENGADAVYLGLKQWSARATATNFTLEELSRLAPYARSRGVSVYVTLNSLLTALDYPGILDHLQALSDLQVDALIVQDPAFFHLVPRYFPELKLHASTLAAVHNVPGVNRLEAMGARRIVLARELSLDEIQHIAENTRADLEVFVHGALCFSYSGLCLASSFRGGHSGLQGRCVQPCRLPFSQGKKKGFHLSCNDFCALPFIPRLRKMRLAAVKIEGRMKSADWVAQVVRAYRMVLDAPDNAMKEALQEARDLVLQTPSRRLTDGFLASNPSEEILAPHRSGSSGLWIGTVQSVRDGRVFVELRHDLRPGDRLRPESKKGREENAFTVSRILSESGSPLAQGEAESTVELPQPGGLHAAQRLFRVGAKAKTASRAWKEIRKSAPRGLPFQTSFPDREKVRSLWPEPVLPGSRRSKETLYLKLGNVHDLSKALQTPAEAVILTATRSNLEHLARKRLIPAQRKRFFWSLPPLLHDKDLDYYAPAVQWFLQKGFTRWEINNWSHLEMFPDKKHVSLMAGYRFNARNAPALATLAEAGCFAAVLSLEITREELQVLRRVPPPARPVVTVYAWPPLFLSRLQPKVRQERPLTTPKGEAYQVRRRQGQTHLYADRPVNWLGHLSQLRGMGYRAFLLDLSEGPQGQEQDMERLLSGFKRERADKPFSLFNYELKAVPDKRK